MITVIKVNKQGNKIVSYTCEHEGIIKNLTKEQLISAIQVKQVSNARLQV